MVLLPTQLKQPNAPCLASKQHMTKYMSTCPHGAYQLNPGSIDRLSSAYLTISTSFMPFYRDHYSR